MLNNDEIKRSVLAACREFAAPAKLVGEPELDVSPHYKFDEELFLVRCIHNVDNGRQVVAYQVFDKATGLRRPDKEPTDEKLISWLDECEYGISK